MTDAAYFDRDDKPITQAQWELLGAQPTYTTLREYRGLGAQFRLKWIGMRGNAARLVIVDDVNCLLGRKLALGELSNQRFGAVVSAVSSYEDLLVRQFGCEWFPGPNGMILMESTNELGTVAKVAPENLMQNLLEQPAEYGTW